MNSSRIGANLGHAAASRRTPIHKSEPSELHRTAQVCEQEGLTVRTIARRMRIPASQARAELDPYQDLKLSQLYRWQSALNVPLIDLLVQPDVGLSNAIHLRAKLLRVMKTLRTIQETAQDEQLDRLVARMDRQLIDVMPELKEVSSWPSVGKRRTLDELGAVADRQLPESMFNDEPQI